MRYATEIMHMQDKSKNACDVTTHLPDLGCDLAVYGIDYISHGPLRSSTRGIKARTSVSSRYNCIALEQQLEEYHRDRQLVTSVVFINLLLSCVRYAGSSHTKWLVLALAGVI